MWNPWWEDAIAQGKDNSMGNRTRAHMQTRAMARAGEYHLALGPPARDATRATKANMSTRASHMRQKGWGAHHGHADKSKPVEGKGWGVHPRSWPSDKGLQGKHADKGKPVEGQGKGGGADGNGRCERGR